MDTEHRIPLPISNQVYSSINTWWPLLFWELLDFLVDELQIPIKSQFYVLHSLFSTCVFTDMFEAGSQITVVNDISLVK